MLKKYEVFSKTCQYGIRAILYLAVHTSEDKKLGVEQISNGLDIPKHFLAKILQQLTKHHLASSSKGRNGGFYLNTENKNSSLLKVIHAIDGSDVFSLCILGLPECSSQNPCSLHQEALKQRSAMLKILEDQDIQQIAKRIDLKHIKI